MKIILLAFLAMGGMSAVPSFCLACDEGLAAMAYNTLYLDTKAECEVTEDDRRVIPGMI